MHTSPSGKKYIGITSRELSKRFGGSGQYYANCPYFYKAIQKYGWENITHEVLAESLTYDDAVRLEKYYISYYQSNNHNYGYNLTDGGEGRNGYTLSDDGKRLLSKNRQGINAHGYNHFPSKETKEKMSISNMNKIFSDESRLKMSRAKCKKVYQYSLDGNLLSSFDSASEAAAICGIKVCNICACCRRIAKKAGGYFWSYNEIGDPSLIVSHINGENVFPVISGRNEKPVLKLSLAGDTICKYNSIKEASVDTNIPAQEISQACKNNNKVTREFKWKYA